MNKRKRLYLAVSMMLVLLLSMSVIPAGALTEDDALADEGETAVPGAESVIADEAAAAEESAEGETPEENGSTADEKIPLPPEASDSSAGSFVTKNGKIYFYDENNVMAVNRWITYGGKRYFATRTGAISTNSILEISQSGKPVQSEENGLKNYRDTVRYCTGSDGSIQSGIAKINGKYYYCDPANDDTVLMGGTIDYKGKRYYASPDGSLYTNRFITFEDPERYYVGSDGSVQSGIIYVDGKYYFCDPDNNNRVFPGGEFIYKGKKYYASPDGSLYTNRFITFTAPEKYYVGSDGSVQSGIIYVDGKYYYADSSKNCRIAVEEWVLLDKKYYASSDGSFYTDRILTFSNNTKYYVGETGAVQTGINKFNGEYYYCDSAEGGKIAINKWVDVAGNRYFASGTGAFYTGRFISDASYYYYMDSYGRLVREPFVVRGVTITPNPTTGAITKAQYDKIYDYRSPLPYDNYVLVDIPSQTLRYYVNGFEAMFCYVVTGDYYQHPTPTGTFYLNGGKAQNVTLVGEDYETPVSYWMPFIGGAYGLHDATWRGAFGGSIYIGNGSHGCVNMPYEKARELYFMIPVGTMVIVR